MSDCVSLMFFSYVCFFFFDIMISGLGLGCRGGRVQKQASILYIYVPRCCTFCLGCRIIVYYACWKRMYVWGYCTLCNHYRHSFQTFTQLLTFTMLSRAFCHQVWMLVTHGHSSSLQDVASLGPQVV
jgi:hypothetical protein